VGVRGQLSRVFGPIVLDPTAESLATPVNRGDENGASISFWTDVGDTSFVSGSIDVVLTFVEEDGALNANAPVPVSSTRASVSIPVDLFGGYLSTRLTALVEYEDGLARGPWDDLVDDSRVSLALRGVGEVGSARIFAQLENVLGTDSARVPGMDPGEPSFSMGFSWRFVD
jgi:hypothetical protein